MSLGTFSVGVVIFFIVTALVGVAIKCLAEDNCNGIALGIILVVCLYCAISGTYFLYTTGQI